MLLSIFCCSFGTIYKKTAGEFYNILRIAKLISPENKKFDILWFFFGKCDIVTVGYNNAKF